MVSGTAFHNYVYPSRELYVQVYIYISVYVWVCGRVCVCVCVCLQSHVCTVSSLFIYLFVHVGWHFFCTATCEIPFGLKGPKTLQANYGKLQRSGLALSCRLHPSGTPGHHGFGECLRVCKVCRAASASCKHTAVAKAELVAARGLGRRCRTGVCARGRCMFEFFYRAFEQHPNK